MYKTEKNSTSARRAHNNNNITYILYTICYGIIISYGDDIERVRSAQSIYYIATVVYYTIYNMILLHAMTVPNKKKKTKKKRASGTGSTLPKCPCAHSYTIGQVLHNNVLLLHTQSLMIREGRFRRRQRYIMCFHIICNIQV